MEVFRLARKTPLYAPVIRYLRESHQMTRTQLANRLAVQDYYIGYMEDGYRYPRPRQVLILSHVFDWPVFELALLTDVEIPYPNWPRLEDLPSWLALANQWFQIADVIQRYTLAQSLFREPTWLSRLYQQEPSLKSQVDAYGFIALYGFLRDRWESLSIPTGRQALPTSLDDVLNALGASDRPEQIPPITIDATPKWWKSLSPRQQQALESMALTLVQDS